MLSRLTTLARSPAPPPCPAVVAQTPAPNPWPKTKARKPARIYRLYPTPLTPAAIQARALLALIREQCPDAIGKWIVREELARAYAELAEREGWTALTWCRIGRELGKLTKRQTVKRDGRKLTAYLVQARRN